MKGITTEVVERIEVLRAKLASHDATHGEIIEFNLLLWDHAPALLAAVRERDMLRSDSRTLVGIVKDHQKRIAELEPLVRLIADRHVPGIYTGGAVYVTREHIKQAREALKGGAK